MYYLKITHFCSNYLHHEPLKSRMQFGCVNTENKWKLQKLIPFKNGLTKKTAISIAMLNIRTFNLAENCTDF